MPCRRLPLSTSLLIKRTGHRSHPSERSTGAQCMAPPAPRLHSLTARSQYGIRQIQAAWSPDSRIGGRLDHASSSPDEKSRTLEPDGRNLELADSLVSTD